MTPVIDAAALVEPLRQFLPRQRWYSGTDAPSSVVVEDSRVLDRGWPALVDLIVDADGARYQVPVGLRPSGERPDFLRGHDGAVVGEVGGNDGPLLAYDAVLDPVLGLSLLDVVSGSKESADRVRPVGGEQSNSSLVYDDRLILKVFRRIHSGRNLDVEMTAALSEAGFEHVARPLATLTVHDDDLAVLQPFLVGGSDGWALALTSLRDLFGVGDTQPVPVISADMAVPAAVDPAMAGGDFSAEAFRLGRITAQMHRALAEAFGRSAGDTGVWADIVEAQVEAEAHPQFDRAAAKGVLAALRGVSDAGPAIRLHGDYHLGQVMRTDAGWYVLDFEGEPARPPEERRRPSSPLRDVAGMLRSFHYASLVAQLDRHEECGDLAAAWEERNRGEFLKGYRKTAATAGLVADPAATEVVLAAFELEKAVYELGYERAYRPDWQSIPLAALQRLGAR